MIEQIKHAEKALKIRLIFLEQTKTHKTGNEMNMIVTDHKQGTTQVLY